MIEITTEILKTTTGYDIDSSFTPNDLGVVEDLGNNQVTLTIDSTKSPDIEDIILRIQVIRRDPSNLINRIEIDFGDSTSIVHDDMSASSFFDQVGHTYTSAGTYNIVVRATEKITGNLTTSTPIAFNANPQGGFNIDQYLIERRQLNQFGNTYKILTVANWRDASSPSYIDTINDLNYQYRYRVKFRSLDNVASLPLNETQFSNYVVVN